MGIGRDISGDGKIGGPTSSRDSAGRCIDCTLLFDIVVFHWSWVQGLVARVQKNAPALQQNGPNRLVRFGPGKPTSNMLDR